MNEEFFCKKCNNSGRISNRSIIRYCDCVFGKKLKKPKFNVLFQKSNLPQELTKLTLEDFSVYKNHKDGKDFTKDQMAQKEYAKKVTQLYEKQIKKAILKNNIILPTFNGGKYEGNNLFFYGGESSGKTMLSVNILKNALCQFNDSLAAYYMDWSDLVTRVFPFNGEWKDILDLTRNTGILCLDSVVDGGIDSKHVEARITSIIKYRLLKNKPTIITSTYSPLSFQQTHHLLEPLINKCLKIKLNDSIDMSKQRRG